MKPFCLYPFTQLLLQPTGDISPCCWRQDLVLGNIKTESLDEIWNSPALQQLRREFLQETPVSCASTIRNLNCYRLSHFIEQDQVQLAEFQSGPPVRLDVRLNGQCNLECVMCDVWKQPNGTYDASEFWTDGPTRIFPFLKEIDLLGGEPFIQKDTYRLINAVSEVNPKCSWKFNTNGSYLLNEFIIQHLDKIEIRRVSVSLDSVNPKTYEKIRRGGQLKKTLNTVREFHHFKMEREQKGRPFTLSISMCVQLLNWREVPEFLTFAEDQELDPVLQFALAPDRASLLAQPAQEQRAALELFFDLVPKYGLVRLKPLILPLSDALKSAAGGASEALDFFTAT